MVALTRFFHRRERSSAEVFKRSYAQCGEDLIVDFVLGQCVKGPHPSYLDIGAHHPVYMSNTYLFYERGARGVCVEPDPYLFAEFRRVRPHDKCLNVGIGATQKDKGEFFRMSTPTLNTFSREVAEQYEASGNQKIEEVMVIPILPVNTMMAELFDTCPNFVSLDVEGHDFEILEAFDFSLFRPQVFCIETLTYAEDKSEKKIGRIAELMSTKGYFAYADTYINTIFVESEAWLNR